MRFSSLFDDSVVCLEGAPEELAEKVRLTPAEERAIERAVRKRQAQYRATRYLARRAFVALGRGEGPLLNHEDRSPVWPEGVVGSVTHSDDWCAVAVASRSHYVALGIDVEAADRMKPELQDSILTPNEVETLPRETSAEERRRTMTLLFSAKESLYKCQYPLSKRFLGFHDVEVDLDEREGRFQCRLVKAVEGVSDLRAFEGRYALLSDRVMTAVVCRQA